MFRLLAVSALIFALRIPGSAQLEKIPAKALDSGVLRDLERKFDDSLDRLIKRLSEKTPPPLEPKTGIHLLPSEARELKSRVLIEASSKEDETLARRIADDVSECSSDAIFKKPLERSAQAGIVAGFDSIVNGASLTDAVSTTLNAFNARVEQEAAAFRDRPDEKIAEILRCVGNKALVNPLKAAWIKCSGPPSGRNPIAADPSFGACIRQNFVP